MSVYLGDTEVGVSIIPPLSYGALPDKPQINGVELLGNKTTEELGIVSVETDPTVPTYVKNITQQDIDKWNAGGNKEDIQRQIDALKQEKASTDYVDTKVADLIGAAPETRDTLEELAKALEENADVVDALNSAISDKADKSDIPVIPTKVSSFENDIGYLTEVPSEYITENELDNKGYLTSVPNEYITEEELNNKGYTTTSDVENAVKDKATTDYVDNKFNGANKSVSFVTYSAMISSLNDVGSTSYNVGQNILIVSLRVPDLWVSEIAEESVPYTYVSDNDFITDLNLNGSVQVGFFKLSALETAKVDLTEYVKNTDYATSTQAGIIKASSQQGFYIGTAGDLSIIQAQQTDIDNRSNKYRPITSHNLDYAVKVSLTTNTETLTNEEKAAAQSWLGVPKITATQNPEDGSYSLTIGG